ncbi:MAG: hypothetical protein ACQEQU_00975 [Spirochaetota bacterium]
MSASAFTFIVMIRKHFRNSQKERRRLASLLEDLTARYGSTVFVAMCKKNNVSVMQAAVISDLIRPIIFDEYESAGHYLNVVFKQVKTPYALVLWDDMQLDARLGETLVRWLLYHEPLCSGYFSYESDMSPMPVLINPELTEHDEITVSPAFPQATGEATLFPYDYAGIYTTEYVFSTGGFDEELDDGYWQLLDFGLSAWTRARPIVVHEGLVCRYLVGHTMQYEQQCRFYKKFRAKHFGYTVDQKYGTRYKGSAKRVLREWFAPKLVQAPELPVVTTRDLISTWGSQ